MRRNTQTKSNMNAIDEQMQGRDRADHDPADRPVRVEHVALDRIVEDGANPRSPEADDEVKIAGLVESFRTIGQLSPVRVYTRQDGTLLLGFGHRRVKAARRLGWTTIVAEIRPMPEDPAEIVQARAIENLERDNLNPFEEAAQVAQLLESLAPAYSAESFAAAGDECRSAMIAAAASKLGRSATWIRDRGYLARLDKSVKARVVAGELPLGHAREIAKLADPGLQKDAADRYGGRRGIGVRPIESLKRWVRQQMRSLKAVPWDTSIEFANKPACDGCPHNTANDRQLFEHDTRSDVPKDGLCLNEACFLHKQKATGKALERARQAMIKKKIQATPAEAKRFAPAWVKPARLVREVKRERGELPRPSPPAGSCQPPQPTRKEVIERQFRELEWRWYAKARGQLREAIKARPARLIASLLAGQTMWACGLYHADRKTVNKGRAILNAVGESSTASIEVLLKMVLDGQRDFNLGLAGDRSPMVIEEIARMWGVALEPYPDKEQLIRKAEVQKPAATRPVPGGAPPMQDLEEAAREAGEGEE